MLKPRCVNLDKSSKAVSSLLDPSICSRSGMHSEAEGASFNMVDVEILLAEQSCPNSCQVPGNVGSVWETHMLVFDVTRCKVGILNEDGYGILMRQPIWGMVGAVERTEGLGTKRQNVNTSA